MATIVGSGLESYIKRNARERAMNGIARADAEAGEILRRSDQRVRMIRQESQALTEAKIEANHRRLLAQAELESQGVRITRREAMLEEVWTAARLRLLGLIDPGERRMILDRLLVDAACQLGGGRLVVRVSEQDRLLLNRDTLLQLESDLESQCGPTELELAPEPAHIMGGVIVQSQDGRRLVDNSWDGRLLLARDVLRDQVYHRLTTPGGPDSPRQG